MNYQEYMKSTKWKNLRRVALSRAHYQCQNCGKRGKLWVSHVKYDTLQTPREIDDLIVLCETCHKATYKK